ncbi:MAG: hypothetical protein WCO93_05305, partial [bacterium]
IIPNIFFGIREKKETGRTGQWKSTRQVLDEIYGILFGIRFPRDISATLRNAIMTLPEGASIFQVGFMIPRKTEVIRLVVTSLPRDAMTRYLSDIGWPDDTNVAGELSGRLTTIFDRIVYNINIGRSVLPFLGMELYLGKLSQPQHDPRWTRVMDQLVSDGLLLETKREALLRFCGKRTIQLLYPIRYICGINHLKFVYRKGIPNEVKGYFGTMIRPDIINQ